MGSGSTMHHNKFNPMERGPRLLRDFLLETSNSCSSSGFKSFPRKPISPPSSTSMRSLIEIDLNSRNSNSRILRKLSSKSPFQTLVNAFKFKSISFPTVKSPSFLPRSLSRKLSRSSFRRENEKKASEIKITVKIKDIVRWQSFRDLVEEQYPPLDFALSPQHCTTATTTTSSTSSTSCSSKASSWSDSDFTASWDGHFVEIAQNDVGSGKMSSPFVGKGKDSVETTTRKPSYAAVGAKGGFSWQEEEGHSPVSVLDVGRLDFENLEQWLSLIESTAADDEVEKRARQLLNSVKAKLSVQSHESNVLVNFFRNELDLRRNQVMNDDELEKHMLKIAQHWIDGSFVYEIQHNNRVGYIKEMDTREKWSKFEEEQRELGLPYCIVWLMRSYMIFLNFKDVIVTHPSFSLSSKCSSYPRQNLKNNIKI